VRNRDASDSSGESTSAAPDQVSVRTQLEHILKSWEFNATDRSRKFLAHVVEETLGGRADRIKAYSIATDVFGRDASFDPRSDPIVRVEAGYLRRALEHYYLAAGRADPVIITIPTGSYVPIFEARQSAVVVAPDQVLRSRHTLAIAIAAMGALVLAAWLGFERIPGIRSQNPDIPRLLVRPFDDLSNSESSQLITRGLTEEIIGEIAKFKEIVTVEGSPDENELRLPANAGIRYALAGGVSIDDDRIRLRARVLSLANGDVIWANSYDGDLRASKLIEIEDEIARQVVTVLGQPYGVIFQADASRKPRHPPDDWRAYACTLSYYAYRVTLDAKTHPAVRRCLEEAVSRFPSYATAWALLSQTYIDEMRFRYPVDPSSSPASIDRALAAARRAVELDPENVRAREAEMFALYFNGQIEAALKIGEQALNTNPNDTELIGEYGFRLALSGNWTRGCAMLEQVREQNPGPLAYYEAGLALCSYFRSDYREAAMWIEKTAAPGNPNYHLIAAAIFGEGGQTADANRERDWLMAYAPKNVANFRSDMAMRFARPEDVDRLIGSLRKAGLPIPAK
jgi:TolB-like protein